MVVVVAEPMMVIMQEHLARVVVAVVVANQA
jgi:hypothetical protein